MTEPLAPADDRPKSYRQRHRERRQREFLDTALDIVAAEGLGALTMKRITETLVCSAGSIYQYFPSKGALIAEVQREAIVTLGDALIRSQTGLEARLEDEQAEARVAALTRVLGAARFWVSAETVFPREVELSRSLFTAPTDVLTVEEAASVVPSGVAVIRLATGLFDAAVAAGALDPGDSFDRTVVVLTATTGVLMAAGMARWDDRVADTRPLADQVLGAQFRFWGARTEDLAHADRIIDDLAAAGRLVPAAEAVPAR